MMAYMNKKYKFINLSVLIIIISCLCIKSDISEATTEHSTSDDRNLSEMSEEELKNLKYHDNLIRIQSNDKIEVRYSKEKGLHCIARKDIKKNENIININNNHILFSRMYMLL